MNIVVDTSALAAIVFGEPEAETFALLLTSNAGGISVSAATWVEAGIVILARVGSSGLGELRTLATAVSVDIVSLDASQANLAIAAWRRFGKGHHPAALNLGDCYSYALAKQSGAALLFKGSDFAQTDVMSALG